MNHFALTSAPLPAGQVLGRPRADFPSKPGQIYPTWLFHQCEHRRSAAGSGCQLRFDPWL